MTVVALTDLKSYLGIGTTGDDALLTTLISAAQTEVESYCHRSFDSSSGITRYYRQNDLMILPEGSQYRPAGYRGAGGGYSWDSAYNWGYSGALWPGTGGYGYSGGFGHTVCWLGKDLLSVDTLLNGDGTTLTSTSYWLEPRNEPPYQWIRLKSSNAWVFGTDGEITVTGTWGYSTSAPADIVQAVKRVAAYNYRGKDSQVFDVTADPEAGVITIPKGIPADVKVILDRGGYTRRVGTFA